MEEISDTNAAPLDPGHIGQLEHAIDSLNNLDIRLKNLHEPLETIKLALEIGLIFIGVLAFKWIRDWNNRSTDVLLKLEDQFNANCRAGRPFIEDNDQYQKLQVHLKQALATGKLLRDGQENQACLDDLLRFYVILCSIRAANQVSDAALSISYRFWLAHYYRKDREAFRQYVNQFFPTIAAWLQSDAKWQSKFFWRPGRAWPRFFKPDDFWRRNQQVRDIGELREKLVYLKRIPEARILVLTGSGISAESGIPTFWGKDGYYRNEKPENLATQEAFNDNPKKIWEWYRERRKLIRSKEPNGAHEAITRLALEAKEFLLVTQNVDDLHLRANWASRSIKPEAMVKLHGDIFVTRCTDAQCPYIVKDTAEGPVNSDNVPTCPTCGKLARPGVVWFDEDPSQADEEKINKFIDSECDAVLVVGTAARFDYIRKWALKGSNDGCHLIEFNPETTPLSKEAHQRIEKKAVEGLATWWESVDSSRTTYASPEEVKPAPAESTSYVQKLRQFLSGL